MKDVVGATCSGFCLIHCVVLPVLLAVGIPLPVFAAAGEESVHLGLSVVMVITALLAFPSAWRRHRVSFPSLLALFGISLLLIAFAIPEALEIYIMSLSGLLLITAHLFNRHYLNRAKLTV